MGIHSIMEGWIISDKLSCNDSNCIVFIQSNSFLFIQWLCISVERCKKTACPSQSLFVVGVADENGSHLFSAYLFRTVQCLADARYSMSSVKREQLLVPIQNKDPY